MTAASTRLSVMMFLEYLIWGSWLPLLALYLGDVLGFTGSEIGWIFATQAIACVFGLYFGGQIADRMVSTEKLLALLHLVGGIAMFALAFQKTFWPFFAVMLAYQLAYMPTMSLTNAICFHHISNAQTEFGKLRLWGTMDGSPPAGRSSSSSPARPGPIFTPRSRASSPWPASHRSHSPHFH